MTPPNTVHSVAALIHSLTPAERYRLAAVLFDRHEPASTALAHVVVAQAVAAEAAQGELVLT